MVVDNICFGISAIFQNATVIVANLVFLTSCKHLNNIRHGQVCLVSHEADDGEDDEAGEDAGGTVGEGNEDGVPVAVVGELVVAGQRDQTPEAGAQRVEDLCGRVSPNLRIHHQLSVKLC